MRGMILISDLIPTAGQAVGSLSLPCVEPSRRGVGVDTAPEAKQSSLSQVNVTARTP